MLRKTILSKHIYRSRVIAVHAYLHSAYLHSADMMEKIILCTIQTVLRYRNNDNEIMTTNTYMMQKQCDATIYVFFVDLAKAVHSGLCMGMMQPVEEKLKLAYRLIQCRHDHCCNAAHLRRCKNHCLQQAFGGTPLLFFGNIMPQMAIIMFATFQMPTF